MLYTNQPPKANSLVVQLPESRHIYRKKLHYRAKGFWSRARRKTDGYLQVTRGMTTPPYAKRTSFHGVVPDGNWYYRKIMVSPNQSLGFLCHRMLKSAAIGSKSGGFDPELFAGFMPFGNSITNLSQDVFRLRRSE